MSTSRSMPSTLQPNLLLSHHAAAKRLAHSQQPATTNDENQAPNHRAPITLMHKQGYDAANKENVMVTRSMRSTSSLLGGGVVSCASGTTAISTSILQQKPRRVLQEIKTDPALPLAPPAASTASAGPLSSTRRAGATIALHSHLSSGAVPPVHSAASAAVLPGLAAISSAHRAATNGHHIPTAHTRTLTTNSSAMLTVAAPHTATYKPHLPLAANSQHAHALASHAATSLPSTSASLLAPSSSDITVPASFLTGNFTSSALSSFCAASHVSQLTAVQEKEREIARQQQQQQQRQMPTREPSIPTAAYVPSALPSAMSTQELEAEVHVESIVIDTDCTLEVHSKTDLGSTERSLLADAVPCEEETSDDADADLDQTADTAMDLCSSPMSDAHITAPIAAPLVPPFGSVPTHMPASDAHLWSADLTSDIMNYWFSSECRYRVASDYLQHQPDLNSKMREILIDWLQEVVSRFRLQSETMFLAVSLLDRFLSVRAVSRKKLQLVGCVALIVAAKYEEIYTPDIKDFLTISDHAYEREHVLHMEGLMLNALQFHLTCVTPLRFMQRFLNTREADFMIAAREGHTRPTQLASYLLELTLQFVCFLAYRPSTIAASVVYLVANHAHVERGSTEPYVWSEGMECETHHTADDLRACVHDIYTHWYQMTETGMAAMAAANGAAAPPPSNKCLAIYRKYGKDRYGIVNQVQIHRPNLMMQV